MDLTLFTIYEQEKLKHSLETELYPIAKIAIQIIGHDPKDCGMSRSDFECILQICQQFFM
jgi:hypothetical protein